MAQQFVRFVWDAFSGSVRPFSLDTPSANPKLDGFSASSENGGLATKKYVDDSTIASNESTFTPAEASGLSAVTHGARGRYRTIITLTDVVVGTRDDTVEDLAFGFALGAFQSDGAIVTGVSASLSIVGEGTTHDIELAIGSSDAEEAEATIGAISEARASDISNGRMATADMTTTPSSNYVGGGAVVTAAYLNMAAAWLADNEGDLVANGTIVLIWDDLTLA